MSTYHHGNLRQAMLDAALTLLETKGKEGVSLRAAARIAGVSRTAPYRHFADKKSLLAALAEAGYRSMGTQMRAAIAPIEAPEARLEALGTAYVEFAVRHRQHFRLMFGLEMSVEERTGYPTLEEAARETFAMLLQAVSDCQDAGIIRPAPLHELTLVCWSTVHGLSSLLVDAQMGFWSPDSPVEPLAQTLSRHLMNGLAALPTFSPG